MMDRDPLNARLAGLTTQRVNRRDGITLMIGARIRKDTDIRTARVVMIARMSAPDPQRPKLQLKPGVTRDPSQLPSVKYGPNWARDLL